MIYVTAVHMEGGNEHEHISDVKWRNPEDGKAGESTRATVVDWIKSKGGVAKVTEGQHTVPVEVYREQWLRTKADGVWKDNLLALPRY